jgi:secretion/DNA translocation related TadE-like protein
MRTTSRSGERGTAAVLVLVCLGVLVMVALVLAFQGGVLVAQRRAQAAADLAALAGASALQRRDDGCAAATANAARNGARVSRCRIAGVSGQEVVVTVARAGPELLGRSLDVEASARAGPDPVP